jgi:hypothetical protein
MHYGGLRTELPGHGRMRGIPAPLKQDGDITASRACRPGVSAAPEY